MDILSSLFNKKQYELIISITKNSSEPDELFFCLSSYLALNKVEEALSFIKSHRKLLETRLSRLMKTHIELLCSLQKFDEAYDEVKYYGNLPYDSQVSEEILMELPNIIRKYERGVFKKQLDEDQIIKHLTSNDASIVIGVLDYLEGLDITPYLIYVSKIMINHEKQFVRTFALFLLVSKKIDKVFKFKHHDKILELNPNKLEQPFKEKFANFVTALSSIYQDPSIEQSAVEILSTYIIYLYPNIVNYEDPNLADALRIVATNYLKIDYKPTLNEKLNALVEDIYLSLEESI